MTLDKLTQGIQRFREWLSGVPFQAFDGRWAEFPQAWSEELKAIERLLETQEELPIAFLGPSQQGKSSLINALVGQNVLAVGGAVGACTCVVTSIHYRSGPGFFAEIEFISLEDWRGELTSMQDALVALRFLADTPADEEERDISRRDAFEKFHAVYRTDPDQDIARVLGDANLGMPPEIAAHMRNGNPIRLEFENPQTFRNELRRYLVGREQHADGQFWPVISHVRVYGDFPVLSHGVALVDLPGLNDPNPARERVTRRYLNDASYLWLICNSQTGIDRVLSKVLRDNGLLFRLFLEGRLDAFSVVTTKIDEINIEAILEQMGADVEAFDGDLQGVLQFRREQIADQVRQNLLSIGRDIVSRAQEQQHAETFLNRVDSLPVYSVSTSAYLHNAGRMPLYAGPKLDIAETHIPCLIDHLQQITLERSRSARIEAAARRLNVLWEQARRFFLDLITWVEQSSEASRQEWSTLQQVAHHAIDQAGLILQQSRLEIGPKVRAQRHTFSERVQQAEQRAAIGLVSVVQAWGSLNWRSLRAAVSRKGRYFSSATGREIDLNRDLSRAYLDLLPFIWEDFFRQGLGAIVDDSVNETSEALKSTAIEIQGALSMLKQQPPGLSDSIRDSFGSAQVGFRLQSGQLKSAILAEIQRTRQSLSNGLIETATAGMQSAYEEAAREPVAEGIKGRMLEILGRHAREQGPPLFVNLRQELSDGVGVLLESMVPQTEHIVRFGEGILNRFRQNLEIGPSVDPESVSRFQRSLNSLPDPIT
ncbi:MAG: dynamin family protein [Verrucomicrobia bacterium]|nr:dynamin family protein [Verrucomicrobiota bacterium]